MSSCSRLFLMCVLQVLCIRSVVADERDDESSVKGRVQTESNGDVILIHEVTTKASIDVVWAAYTTTEGWKAWVTPNVEVDLRVGGVIRSNYRKDGKLTDDDAIVNHIVNYVPERVLTLQAELMPHFPAALKEREEHLFNIVTFNPLPNGGTKVISYGTGYRDTAELREMLKFFLRANETHFQKLIDYVETGKAEPVQTP